MKINTKKKLLYLFTALTVIQLLPIEDTRYIEGSKEIIAEYNDDILPFAYYKEGKVYIGDIKYIQKASKICDDNDILILDERQTKNPNMKIYNSYKIVDNDIKKEVLKILQDYEQTYPSEWNRTFESMYNEWVIHNVLYDFKIKVKHTSDVDLDNEDETLFRNITDLNNYQKTK